jgi:hypothetical protein
VVPEGGAVLAGLGRLRRRISRALTRPLSGPRRVQTVIGLLALAAVAVLLLRAGDGIDHYQQNLAINIGADMIGAIVTVFVITPLIARAQDGRVREHPRLDYEWFVDQVPRSTSWVQVLDTFSNLLDRPVTARFFRALEQALQHRAHIQILLLDPDSLAVSMRAQELGQGSGQAGIRAQIMRNLRTLDAFQRDLPERYRRRFEVRVYSAASGVTLYRWDDKALVSFLTVGRLSGQGSQLEVAVGSPLGTFVGQRFDELWHAGRPMDQFMRMLLRIDDPAGALREFSCPFVQFQDMAYVLHSELIAHLADHRDGGLHAYRHDDPDSRYELVLIDDASDEFGGLLDHFDDKYDLRGSAFVWLRPVP